MKNEIELSDIYFDKREIPTRRELWNKIEELQSQLAEKNKKQNQKVISELEKLKDFFLEPYKDEEMGTDFLITKDAGSIADYVLDRIKELGGREHVKN